MANIRTNLSGALTQVSAGIVIMVETLACSSLLSTVYPISIAPVQVQYHLPQPLIRASRTARNNFIKLIVLLLFNVKQIT
jgi:hypothetical protein